MAQRYDLVVIGAGPGGYVAAIRAAQLGMKVACVEKRASLGGTCLNVGCIPSKAMLDSSELYHLARERFGRHGIKVDGLGLDLAAMLKRKNEVVKSLTDGVRYLFRKNKVEAILGAGRLTSPTTVQVAGSEGAPIELEAGHILLATGSEPTPFRSSLSMARRSSTRRMHFASRRSRTTWWWSAAATLAWSWARSGSAWGRRSRSSSSFPASSPWPMSRSVTSSRRA